MAMDFEQPQESGAMEQRAIDTLGEVRKFAPKRPPNDSDSMDESGQAVLAMLQKAADLSMANS